MIEDLKYCLKKQALQAPAKKGGCTSFKIMKKISGKQKKVVKEHDSIIINYISIGTPYNHSQLQGSVVKEA